MQPGELLWTPGPERIRQANVTALADWLARQRGRHFADYHALWRWSVEDLEGFWQALWDFFAIESSATVRSPGAARRASARVDVQRPTSATEPALILRGEGGDGVYGRHYSRAM